MRTTCARPNALLSTFAVLPADAEVSAPRTGGSIVEPEVLVTKAVVDAVDHHGHPFYLRVTARPCPIGRERLGLLSPPAGCCSGERNRERQHLTAARPDFPAVLGLGCGNGLPLDV